MKYALEEAARQEQESVGKLLERIIAQWLAQRRATSDDDTAEQQRLHDAAVQTFGMIRGDDLDRSTKVSQAVRAKLAQRRAY
jgi:hypothetical protein